MEFLFKLIGFVILLVIAWVAMRMMWGVATLFAPVVGLIIFAMAVLWAYGKMFK